MRRLALGIYALAATVVSICFHQGILPRPREYLSAYQDLALPALGHVLPCATRSRL